MALENKPRIIGIIVLIAFIALLIPFLFTSGKKKQQSASQDVEIPIATSPIAINQENGAALSTSSPEQSSVPLQDVSKEAAKKELSVELPPQPMPEVVQSRNNQVIVPTNGLPAETEASSANIPSVNASVAEETNQLEVESAVSKSTAISVIPKGNSKVVKSKSAKVFWSVQVACFKGQARMQKMATQLKKKGYHVYSQKIITSRGPMHRVLVGHETSKAKAIKIANQLKAELKIDGYVVRNKK